MGVEYHLTKILLN